MSAESTARDYAEQVLHVHDVHTEARQHIDDLREHQSAVIEWADQRRRINEQLADREAEIITDERAKHYDLSQTAFEKHVKLVLQQDAAMKSIREAALEAAQNHDTAEAAVRTTEFAIKVASARMEELGGLLQFYGMVKITRNMLAST